MIELQNKNRFFLFARQDYALPDYERFFTPDYWRHQDRILGSSQGRGTAWFIRSRDLFGMDGVLRHYYRGGLLGKINKDRYHFTSLEKTRSFAELRLLDGLYRAGLPVPRPIAAKVETGFVGYRADILLEKIENAQDLTAFLQQADLGGQSWRRIGGLIRRLHDLQICHTDLNAHNILLQRHEREEKFWLLDFDKCGQKSGDFWKRENLQRLHRSFMKEIRRMNIRFTAQNWQDLLDGYHQGGS